MDKTIHQLETWPMANPNGRPRSETVKLTKTARERFDSQLAEKLPDIFTALFEAGTKDKDTAACHLACLSPASISPAGVTTARSCSSPSSLTGSPSCSSS